MKTKEELLKVYSSYLPYELRLQYENGDNVNLVGVNTKGLQIESEYTHYGYVDIRIEDIKPILHSMDYLTKEIEYEGERFIAGLMLVDPDRQEWDKMICETYKPFPKLPTEYIRVMHESLGEIISINPNNVSHLPYNIFIKLLEMNFNVFNLSDS